jgi:hypothetical protein
MGLSSLSMWNSPMSIIEQGLCFLMEQFTRLKKLIEDWICFPTQTFDEIRRSKYRLETEGSKIRLSDNPIVWDNRRP